MIGRIFKLILVLFLLSLPKITHSENITSSQYVVIHDLSYAWQVFDDDFEAYVPYISSKHQNSKVLNFWLDVNKFKNYQLIYRTEVGQVLLINQKLCKISETSDWQSLSLDSLFNEYQKDKLFITFYDEKKRLPLSNIFIGKKLNGKVSDKPSGVVNSNIQGQTKNIQSSLDLDNLQNFTVIALLVLLIFYALLRNFYPRFFKLHYSLLVNNFSIKRLNSGVTYSHPIFSVSFLFILLSSLLMGLFYVLFQNPPLSDWNTLAYFFGQNQSDNILNHTYKYLLTICIILLFLLSKFLVLFLMGLPLKNKNLLNLHFYEYLRLSNLVYIVLNVIILLPFLSQVSLTSNFITTIYYTIVVLHLFQSIAVSYQVAKYFSFKSLYLFYYLCITELTPLLIGIKFLLLN